MRRVLVLCDNASVPSSIDSSNHEILSINQHAPHNNLRLNVFNVSHWLLKNLNSINRDLLEIASFIYYADNSISRGTIRNVFDDKWVRSFHFVIPVRNPDIWSDEAIASSLRSALEYLSDDVFDFSFSTREPIPEQLAFESLADELPPCPEADCVSLFSGGMDSFAGAVDLHSLGKKPLLLSHQSRPYLARLQDRLAVPLRKRLAMWDYPHLGIWINRIKTPARENSQRTRSFLYLALATILATELMLPEIFVYENGVTSFNLPRVGQTIGALASRSTHPRFISQFQDLISLLYDSAPQLQTPFLWKTRSDIVSLLRAAEFEDLLPLTSSCARSRRPTLYPHCGICSQCVDRRFAVAHSGLDHIPAEIDGYEKDIFKHNLDDGEEKTQALAIVRFALDILERDSISFCERYGEVYDAVSSLPGNPDENLESIFLLHSRFAQEIDAVMAHEHSRNWKQIHFQELPASSLLMLTVQGAAQPVGDQVKSRAIDLAKSLEECPAGEAKELEDICEEVFTFLFCDDTLPEHALTRPSSQAPTDGAYERRDLLFQNRASDGFWAEMKRHYDAVGIVVDAKNYSGYPDSSTVGEFSSKYLKDYGVGRFGIIAARELPVDVQTITPQGKRVQSAVKKQKDEWRDNKKIVLLLEESDLIEMLSMKSNGIDPADLLRDRLFVLRSRA